jgi:hypothetical protein
VKGEFIIAKIRSCRNPLLHGPNVRHFIIVPIQKQTESRIGGNGVINIYNSLKDPPR